jgi:mRNA-degrading endonuclease RelE of RelBE toxin-antitoxin system
MAKKVPHTLSYASEALDHLESIEAKHHGLIERTIEEQLSHTPLEETRNRKPLDPPAPFEASWELRCGPANRFRVFYDVDPDALTVRILAIGVKVRSKLFFGGEEYKLP